MKKIWVLLMVLTLAVFMTACGGSEAEKEPAETDSAVEESVSKAEPSGTEEDGTDEEQPSGVQDDGMGEDPSYGEGIGEVIALSEEEKAYVLAQTTNTWGDLSEIEKDDLIVLIGRWLEDSSGFVVEDYDALLDMVDHQMGWYFRNGVNTTVLETVCDICEVVAPVEIPAQPGGLNEDGIGEEKPSGVWDDGRGEDPSYGEGIGEVVALTEEEQAYMMAQTTNTWLELSQMEKDDLVVLIGRTLEASCGFIVEDYDDLVVMLDHQMEQYFRNGVDESVLATVCDILDVDAGI